MPTLQHKDTVNFGLSTVHVFSDKAGASKSEAFKMFEPMIEDFAKHGVNLMDNRSRVSFAAVLFKTLPNANTNGKGFSFQTAQRSYASWAMSMADYEHQLAFYDPDRADDKICGVVVASKMDALEEADYNKKPAAVYVFGQIWRKAKASSRILTVDTGEVASAVREMSVSMEVLHDRRTSAFFVDGKFIPFAEADKELVACAWDEDEDGTPILKPRVDKWKGKKVVWAYGGENGEVLGDGMAFTSNPADKEAELFSITASREQKQVSGKSVSYFPMHFASVASENVGQRACNKCRKLTTDKTCCDSETVELSPSEAAAWRGNMKHTDTAAIRMCDLDARVRAAVANDPRFSEKLGEGDCKYNRFVVQDIIIGNGSKYSVVICDYSTSTLLTLPFTITKGDVPEIKLSTDEPVKTQVQYAGVASTMTDLALKTFSYNQPTKEKPMHLKWREPAIQIIKIHRETAAASKDAATLQRLPELVTLEKDMADFNEEAFVAQVVADAIKAKTESGELFTKEQVDAKLAAEKARIEKEFADKAAKEKKTAERKAAFIAATASSAIKIADPIKKGSTLTFEKWIEGLSIDEKGDNEFDAMLTVAAGSADKASAYADAAATSVPFMSRDTAATTNAQPESKVRPELRGKGALLG